MQSYLALYPKINYDYFSKSKQLVKQMNNYICHYIHNHTSDTKRSLRIGYEQLEKLLEVEKILHQIQ